MKKYRMKKYILEMNDNEITLNNKPIAENDVLVLLTHIALKNKDTDLKRVIDYWIMLKESGHNGFYLKNYHETTHDKNEELIR